VQRRLGLDATRTQSISRITTATRCILTTHATRFSLDFHTSLHACASSRHPEPGLIIRWSLVRIQAGPLRPPRKRQSFRARRSVGTKVAGILRAIGGLSRQHGDAYDVTGTPELEGDQQAPFFDPRSPGLWDPGRRSSVVVRMTHTLRVGAVAASAAVMTIGASASANSNRAETHQQCDLNGTTIKTAPWKMAIQETAGLRIVRGTRYFIWIGAAGPSCAFARRNVSRLARLGTPLALRRASVDGLQCRVGRPRQPVAWVRPRTAWAGCWTTIGVPAGRYFRWQLLRR
jgi:hypothetical protein